MKRAGKVLKVALLALAGLFALLIAVGMLLPKQTPAEKAAREAERAAEAKQREERSDAWVKAELEKKIPGMGADANRACRAALAPLLKTPSSADFATFGTDAKYRKSKSGEHLFDIESYVDAQNGIGLKVRTEYHCEVLVTPGVGMSVIYLATKGPDGAWKTQIAKETK